MKNLVQLLLILAITALAPLAVADGGKGVTLIHVWGFDNWAWNDTPLSPSTVTCPGGELEFEPPAPPYCAESTTGRLNFRNGLAWSCMTSSDPRMTGVGLYTSNGNFDAKSSGSVWGTWMVVPTENCDKDGYYPEDLVTNATIFWQGTWSGQRRFYSLDDLAIWIGQLKMVGKGVGGDLDGLHFNGTEWIKTYSPFPVPYEFLPLGLGLFDEAEGEFIGTIKE